LFAVLRRLRMQLEMQYVDNVAEKLNLSRDEILRESLKFYLEKIIREIKTDIFKIRTKYGVSSIEECIFIFKGQESKLFFYRAYS
jgi:hypothetical protein